jgi:hypothetical protein
MAMNKLLLPVLLLLFSLPVKAADAAGMFQQGSTQFSLHLGSGYAFDNNYLILGGGASYYVLDGVSVGLSYENWSGSSPAINKTSPFIQYVLNQNSSLHPYVGGFYRHANISGLPGINSVGARAGIYVTSGPSSVIGFGLAYESYMDCQTAIYRSCSESYPEISLIFGF